LIPACARWLCSTPLGCQNWHCLAQRPGSKLALFRTTGSPRSCRVCHAHHSPGTANWLCFAWQALFVARPSPAFARAGLALSSSEDWLCGSSGSCVLSGLEWLDRRGCYPPGPWHFSPSANGMIAGQNVATKKAVPLSRRCRIIKATMLLAQNAKCGQLGSCGFQICRGFRAYGFGFAVPSRFSIQLCK